jgi:hypothetical protein
VESGLIPYIVIYGNLFDTSDIIYHIFTPDHDWSFGYEESAPVGQKDPETRIFKRKTASKHFPLCLF